jgi:5-methylthioadenosine/S-adenosylhomocysteine deaminase
MGINVERVDLLISGGTILTVSDLGTIRNGALAINGDRIVDVGSRDEIKEKYKPEDEIDASDKIVMPGLIDGHMHNAQIMLRGGFNDEIANLPPIWLHFLIPYENYLSYEQIKKASLLSSLNMIKSGTTCFVEAGGPKPDAIAEASLESGIRAMITRSNIDLDSSLPMYEETNDIVKDYERLIKRWHGVDNGRLKVWVSMREVMLDSHELYEKLFRLSEDYNTRVTMHLAEDRTEVDFCLKEFGKRPVELMYEKGFLSEKVLASHMVFLNDKEAKILEKTGASVCWCPYVDAYLMGPSRANDLLARGVNVIFGSDGGAWSNLDLFEQARYGRVSSKILSNSLYHDKTGLTSNEVIKMLTAYGGKALGEPIGKLKKGYKADVLILEAESNLTPSYDVEYTLVNMASSKNVDTVVINGNIVMKNKQVITLNEEEVIRDARKLAYEIESKIEELKGTLLYKR